MFWYLWCFTIYITKSACIIKYWKLLLLSDFFRSGEYFPFFWMGRRVMPLLSVPRSVLKIKVGNCRLESDWKVWTLAQSFSVCFLKNLLGWYAKVGNDIFSFIASSKIRLRSFWDDAMQHPLRAFTLYVALGSTEIQRHSQVCHARTNGPKTLLKQMTLASTECL